MPVSQLEKLIKEILKLNKNLRFEELSKVLVRLGYTMEQPRGGSSHYTFRKKDCPPITIPKHQPLKKVYIEMVADVLRSSMEEDIRE